MNDFYLSMAILGVFCFATMILAAVWHLIFDRGWTRWHILEDPLDERCTICNWKILLIRRHKDGRKKIKCPNCGEKR